MRDENDREVILKDLQRYCELLKDDTLSEDTRRAVHLLISETEELLAEVERAAATTDEHRLR